MNKKGVRAFDRRPGVIDGVKLRKLRQGLGLNQEELTKRVKELPMGHVARSVITRLENDVKKGVYHTLQSDKLLALSYALNVPMHELVIGGELVSDELPVPDWFSYGVYLQLTTAEKRDVAEFIEFQAYRRGKELPTIKDEETDPQTP